MKNKLSTLNFKNKLKKSRKKLLEDLLDCLCIINKSILLIHKKPDKYSCFINVVATKLRILLCEGKNSLINRLWQENKLHPLKRKYHNLGGLYIHDWNALIDKEASTISSEEWIQQPLIYNTNCKISDPNVYIVGEVWSWYGEYAKYYESGITAFNFDASYRIVDAINGTLGWSYSASLQEIYTEIEKYTSDYIDAPFLRNHDQDRISIVFNDDARELRMAAEAVLFLPGNPYIYYGDEVGMLGTRTYMIWGDYYDIITTNVEDYGVDTVSEQLADPNSLLNSYIDIGDARTNSLALMYGDFIPYTSTGLDGYYRVFENGVDKELVVVIHNFSSVTYREIPSEFTSYEILYSSYENNYGGISPKGTIVLKLPFDLLDDLTN